MIKEVVVDGDDVMEHPAAGCPGCGRRLDACVPAPGTGTPCQQPKPGDVTVCLRCGQALIFDADLRPRLPLPGELGPRAVAATDQIKARIRDYRRANPGR